MSFKTLSTLMLCSLFLAGPGAAQEQTEAVLYDRPLPQDAVFLRWLGSKAMPQELRLAMLPPASTDFHPLSATHLEGATAGHYYSVVPGPAGQPRLIAEPQRGKKSKVHLILLNASPQPVRLVLAGKQAEVVKRTDAFASGGRMVNPVAAELAVLSDDGQQIGVVSVALRRGQNVTVLVDSEGVRLVENRFGAVLGE